MMTSLLNRFTLLSLLAFRISSNACLSFLLTAQPLLPLLFAQQRPALRAASRDYFAGKFVLLPRDAQPLSWQMPRALAQVADHELLTPPFSLLGGETQQPPNEEKLNDWLKQVDYAAVDGVIVALDAAQPRAVQRLELLKEVRARRPDLPIYAFAETCADCAKYVENGTLDFLLLGSAQQPAAYKSSGRVASANELESAALLLLARLLNRRFGFAPRFLPANFRPESLSAKVSLLDGVILPPTAEAAQQANLLLFIHLPQTSAPERLKLVTTLTQAANQGVRVALVDFSATKESKEALLADLRQRKLLDRLTAYASADPAQPTVQEQEKTLARALAHASVSLNSLKFLRDDLERLRRTERAQVGLLLSEYLHDWTYVLIVRPKLETFVREQLKQNLAAAERERAENFALNELRPLAEQLFAEQFQRNVHAILLDTGQRAEFELRLLQRLQFRLAASGLARTEISVALHLVHLGTAPPLSAQPRAQWEFLTGRNTDVRLERRFESVNWSVFKTNAELVELSIKLNASVPHAEGYAIRSKGAKEVRRIEITAATPQGAFYALAKLEQLGAEGQLQGDLNLQEAPALAERGVWDNGAWARRDRLELLRLLGRGRLNSYYYAAADDPLRRTRWRENYSGAARENLQALLEAAREQFVELVYVLSPGAALREDDVQALTNKLRWLSALGVRRFALAAENIPAAALRRVNEFVRTSLPNSRLAIVANGAALPELPAEVAVVWPNGVTETAPQRLILRDDLSHNEALLSLGPKRATSLQDAAGFLATPLKQLYASAPLLATAGEFAWDARGYDAEKAFQRALRLLYDERARAGVQIWAQVYGGNNPFAPLFRPQNGEINVPVLEQRLNILQAALEHFSATREQGLLRGELAQVLRRTRAAGERLKNNPAYERLSDGRYRLK